MKPATALLLARPASAADRIRAWSAAICLGIAGGLVLIAIQITTRGGVIPPTPVGPGGPFSETGLSPLVIEEGIDLWIVGCTLLLTGFVLALAWQLLRLGSDARERRMTTLWLAGATPEQTSTIAVIDSVRTAVLGGLLAGPAYLLLWVLLGALPPAGVKMVLAPRLAELAPWPIVILLAALVGAVAGKFTRQPMISTSPRAGRRTLWAGSRWATHTAAALVLATPAGLILALGMIEDPGGTGVWLFGGMLLLIVAAPVVLGVLAVMWSAQRLRAHGTPIDVLAAAVLTGVPGPTGRAVGVLWICGFGVGTVTATGGIDLAHRLAYHPAEDESFMDFFTAYTLTLLVEWTLVGAVVIAATLALSMVERLHDARRTIASLAALGVDAATLLRVLRRQLTVPSMAAMASGTLAGVASLSLSMPSSNNLPGLLDLGVLAAVLVLPVLFIYLVAIVLASALRPRLRAAMDPENLRTV